MPEVEINYLAVLLATLSSMFVGALWYSPLMLGKPWMKYVGLSADDIKATPTLGYLGSFVAGFILAFVMAHFAEFIGVEKLSDAFEFGLWTWLGFAVAISFPHHIFAGRPWQLYFIDMGHTLVQILVMALIIVGLQ